MGRLYVVATAIGNLEDVTLRALRLLGEVDVVAAEDTRTAQLLLAHHGIKARLISYTDHNKDRRIPQILEQLQQSDVALVTDAGTPAISDPGMELVAAAREAGYEVVTVPGASAPIAALSISGLDATHFRFVGFLPRAAGELGRLLAAQAASRDTLVAFESPHRLRRTLEAIRDLLPTRRVAVCRELTKLHEEVFVGTATEALTHFPEPRGEIVLLIEGSAARAAPSRDAEDEARRELAEMRKLGLTRAQATTLLAKRYGLTRRRLYELWLGDDRG